jgi:effector-binding domain-containing protein
VSQRRVVLLASLAAIALLASAPPDRAQAHDGRGADRRAPFAERSLLPLAPVTGHVTLLRPSFDRRAALTTLAPAPASPEAVETVLLTPRPSLVLPGKGHWDEGPDVFRRAFEELVGAAIDHGIAITGRPVAVFRETDDRGYLFDAMLPVAADSRLDHPVVTLGESPGGYALRFVHVGSFDEIDLTYDVIASHLEAEGLEPQDMFIEEFADLDLVADPGAFDEGRTVHIYVFPK